MNRSDSDATSKGSAYVPLHIYSWVQVRYNKSTDSTQASCRFLVNMYICMYIIWHLTAPGNLTGRCRCPSRPLGTPERVIERRSAWWPGATPSSSPARTSSSVAAASRSAQCRRTFSNVPARAPESSARPFTNNRDLLPVAHWHLKFVMSLMPSSHEPHVQEMVLRGGPQADRCPLCRISISGYLHLRYTHVCARYHILELIVISFMYVEMCT